jgi:hypothetical protein
MLGLWWLGPSEGSNTLVTPLCEQCCSRPAVMTISALGCARHPACTRCAGSVLIRHWDDNPEFSGANAVPIEVAMAAQRTNHLAAGTKEG